ncbi:hypothetical protein EDB84DRAFT_490218 [Lactarius hengduanensis]|nr:hypothetical protein EDB84DRAFT_490218 [Lactarius hengduanensis]
MGTPYALCLFLQQTGAASNPANLALHIGPCYVLLQFYYSISSTSVFKSSLLTSLGLFLPPKSLVRDVKNMMVLGTMYKGTGTRSNIMGLLRLSPRHECKPLYYKVLRAPKKKPESRTGFSFYYGPTKAMTVGHLTKFVFERALNPRSDLDDVSDPNESSQRNEYRMYTMYGDFP